MARLIASTARVARASARALANALGHTISARSKLAGALLVVAVATEPRTLAFGALALATSALVTRVMGLDASSMGGAMSVNAFLAGAGVAHVYGASVSTALVAIVAAHAVVAVTASITASLGRLLAMPALSLPFVVVFALLVGAAPALGIEPRAIIAANVAGAPLQWALEGLGYVVFVPSALAGAAVLIALLVHSRIAWSLAVLGALGAAALAFVPRVGADAGLVRVLSLNASLSAVALGSTWFVPSRASYALGALGAGLAMLLTLGLWAPAGRLGVPVLIVPFNAAVALVLLTMRARVEDRSPKAVDFAPGTPEENLAHYRAKVARFGAEAVAMHLPFRGAWSCTQGVDGEHTHRGPWRYAFDFEVRGEGGRLYRDQGRAPEDHHCFGLPVLAAADGAVVQVVDDVPDNAVGGVEIERNWGNLVLLQHGPALYSLCAHLAKGSAAVCVGQTVRRGDVIGACGSSGRSPRPHLHFQLQTSPIVGAPTIPCAFRDVILRGARGEELVLARTPLEGDTLRAIEPEESLARYFALEIGEMLSFRLDGATETIACELDLVGGLVLRSRERSGALWFRRDHEAFTCVDAIGDPRSVLAMLRAAMPRVPFDAREGLVFVDLAPRALGVRRGLGPLADLVAPFEREAGIEMRYRVVRRGGEVVVEGASTRADARGRPLFATSATLSRARGLVSVSIEVRGARRVAVRAEVNEDAIARRDDRKAPPRARRDRAKKLSSPARESLMTTTQTISEER